MKEKANTSSMYEVGERKLYWDRKIEKHSNMRIVSIMLIVCYVVNKHAIQNNSKTWWNELWNKSNRGSFHSCCWYMQQYNIKEEIMLK